LNGGKFKVGQQSTHREIRLQLNIFATTETWHKTLRGKSRSKGEEATRVFEGEENRNNFLPFCVKSSEKGERPMRGFKEGGNNPCEVIPAIKSGKENKKKKKKKKKKGGKKGNLGWGRAMEG